MENNNMPLSIEELSKMNAFEALWNCSKNHLSDIALTYSADLAVENIDRKPMIKKITYRQLINNILRVYKSLKDNGVKRGDIVTYSSITTPELIYTAYASILLGSIFRPIDVRYNSDDLLKQFLDIPSKLFFCSEPFLDRVIPVYKDIGIKKVVVMSFKESLPKIIQIASSLQDKERKKSILFDNNIFVNWNKFTYQNTKAVIPCDMVNKDEVIHLTATTGTTGEPKTLIHNSSNWNAQLYNASHSELDLIRGETFFNCTVPWVDFGIINAIHTFLCNGIVMNLDPLWSAEKNASYIIKNNPHWWMGAPGWLDDLFTNEKYKSSNLSNAKYFITGGAPLYPHKHYLYQEQLDKMSKKGKIAPGYGYSEVSAAASIDLENKPETIGKMWPLVRAEIRDKNTGLVVKDGQQGELWITSNSNKLSQVAIGYYNNTEKTDEIFVRDVDGTRWAKSGDKVKKNSDGTYSWISRYKNILTYNGFNIDCEKIMSKVDEIDEISKTVVFGAITEDGNQMPVICVEINDNVNIDNRTMEDKIYQLIIDEFPEYYKPIDIKIYDKFPVLSMKTDIQSIKSQLLKSNGEYNSESIQSKRLIKK